MINLFEQLLGLVEGKTTLLSQLTQPVPLVANALAPRVDRPDVVIFQGALQTKKKSTNNFFLLSLLIRRWRKANIGRKN